VEFVFPIRLNYTAIDEIRWKMASYEEVRARDLFAALTG